MTAALHEHPTRRLRWLCVAYAFPPINRSGTHRTLAFVRHLDRLGWDATVLTVEPNGETLDEMLLDAVPAGTRVIRTQCPDLIGGIKATLRPRTGRAATPAPHLVPEGHLAIAQRFIAGNVVLPNEPSPAGTGESRFLVQPSLHCYRVNSCSPASILGCGGAALRDSDLARQGHPSDESLGYSHLPLRGISGNTGNREGSTRAGKQLPDERTAAKPQGLRDWFTRLLIIPDSRVGWILPAVGEGLRAIRRCRPDVIYSTSPCMSAHLIALILSRRSGLAWVADFRDPWRGNPFRNLVYPSLDRWDAWLERRVLGRATQVVCNTKPMGDQLCARLPFLADKCTTIMNGFDAERFEGIKPMRIAPANDFVLTHCGQFYGPRSPKVWFAALRRAVNQSQSDEAGVRPPRQLRMVLLGCESFDGQDLRVLAAEAGVGDCVYVLGRKSHAETLSYMAGSDALMLAGSSGVGCELQVPNKLFEYLAVRKPIIAAVSAGSPTVEILRTVRAEALIHDPDDEQGLAESMARIAEQGRVPVDDAWAGIDAFNRIHRAKELAAIFGKAVGLPASPSAIGRQRSAIGRQP